MRRDSQASESDSQGHTPPHGDPLSDERLRAEGTMPEDIGKAASGSGVPSTGADEPERASFTDPLPARSHALDPSVPDSQESREQAPRSPDWLDAPREG